MIAPGVETSGVETPGVAAWSGGESGIEVDGEAGVGDGGCSLYRQ